MNPKTRIFAIGGALLTLGLFLWARELASWHPKLVGVQKPRKVELGNIFTLQSSEKIQALSNDLILVFSDDHAANLWDLKSEKVRFELTVGQQTLLSPDQQSLLTFDVHPGIFAAPLYDVKTGRELHDFNLVELLNDEPRAFQFSRDSQTLLFFARNQIWRANVKTGKFRSQTTINGAKSISVDFSPDNTQFLQLHKSGLSIFDAGSGKKLGFIGGTNLVAAGWSPDGKIVWTWQPNAANFLSWNGRQSQLLRTSVVNSPAEIHFTPDSKFIAVATPKGLEMRDVLSGKLVKTLPGPREEPFDISPDGSFAISVDGTGKIWRWRLK